MSSIIDELTRKRDGLLESLDDTANRIAALPSDAPEEERTVLDQIFERDNDSVKRLTGDIRRREAIVEQRGELKPQSSDEPGAKPQKIDVNEPLTYRKGAPHSFFRDQYNATQGDLESQQRLQRHMSEMRVEMRDLTTSATAGGEFVAPLYLNNEWITLARAGRVTANLMTQRPLPPGTNAIHMPKLSTGGAVAIQASENSAVQETDPVTADYTFGVKTIAGQVDMSRQLFDLSQPGFDEIVFADLTQDYATKLDIQIISGSGSSGQALGIRTVSSINAVTYTDASPTVGELYPKIADAWSRVSTNMFRNADAIVMHPRRWAFFQGAVDTTGRPLSSAEAPANAISRGGAIVSEGLAGSIMGLPVYVDPNIPTNLGTNTREDVILVLRTAELYLYEESAPRTRVFESVGSNTLTVRLQAFGYFAFGAGRYPAAITTISGTGMDPPTF